MDPTVPSRIPREQARTADLLRRPNESRVDVLRAALDIGLAEVARRRTETSGAA